MSSCAACGHSVVAWCPDESRSQEDLVCYDCGLHADSEAAKRIRELEEALREIKGIPPTSYRGLLNDPYWWIRLVDEIMKAVDEALEPPR